MQDVCAEGDLKCHLVQMYSFKDEEVKAKDNDSIVQESILLVSKLVKAT